MLTLIHLIILIIEHRDLGIIFTDLPWHSNYEAIVVKAYKTLCLLKQTFKHTTSPQVKRTPYLTLVTPKLIYYTPLWRPF